MKALEIGGLAALTTVDYPDHLAAVIFCQGCPWRCDYCHNAHLRPRRGGGSSRWTWARVRAFLEDRVGLLEAVVFSGGEPTVQPGLAEAMRDVRALGFKVGLHTAGMLPDRLRTVLPLVDWIGLDIKAPFDATYDRVTGRPGSAALAERSLRLVLASGVPHQLRTTVRPDLLLPEDCRRLARDLDERRAGATVWQEYRARPAVFGGATPAC